MFRYDGSQRFGGLLRQPRRSLQGEDGSFGKEFDGALLGRQDFVRSAWAKGASPARVYFRHVLATVLPALVVLFTLSLPGLVAGSIFVG